jgi:hypothetical protein
MNAAPPGFKPKKEFLIHYIALTGVGDIANRIAPQQVMLRRTITLRGVI